MGSSKGKKREQGEVYRDKARARRRRITMEFLENRRLLSGVTPPSWTPSSSNIFDVQNGPMAKAGQTLINVYKDYTVNNLTTSQLQTKYPGLYFQGSTVAITIRGYGDATSFTSGLKADGMTIGSVLPQPNETYVTGYVPIANLPAVTALSQTIGLAPAYRPVAYTTGAANNEAQAAMGTTAARTTYNVTGAGVNVGVISDSVNMYKDTVGPGSGLTGIAASVKSGDIPSASSVTVLKDSNDPQGMTDEGRAMIENIYDIAPGVHTAFYTAFDTTNPGDTGYAQAITSLATTGKSNIIVDDIGMLDDPMFQTGIIGNAIYQAQSQQGITYFGAAGNSDGNNGGYASPWRGTSANLSGIGQGTYFNFSPSGAAATSLSFTTDGSAGYLTLQWDQPWYTTNGVTSNLNFYVVDSTGAVVASDTSNAVAAQQPLKVIQLPATAGTYSVIIQLASGQAPGHIEFAQFGGDSVGGFVINHTFGNAGGVTYPSSYGHVDLPGVGGVGAVPYWATTGFQPSVTTPISEPFSSAGPSLLVYNYNGTPLASPVVVNGPVLSGADGGNTSFFEDTLFLDTSKPPFGPQEAPTSTNLNPQPNLPSFFGTSSAAPNVAAVAALMKQLSPASTSAQILSAMETTATPVNGQVAGTWNTQSGYGLVNASAALNSINTLHVVSMVPGSGQVVSSAPQYLQVTFNKPVLLSSFVPSDIAVVGPTGVAVTVGTPIGIDSATTPTVVYFPLTITHTPGGIANGTYYDAIQNLLGVDGKMMTPSGVNSFRVADVVAPTITGTSYVGRTIKITFSEPIDQSTINKNNFLFFRANNPQGQLGTASQVIVSNDPRVTLTYDPTTYSVTMNLSALPQTLLPSDVYGMVVTSPTYSAPGVLASTGVTDIVGNPLDGDFNGTTFPTGNGVAGGNFGQVLPVTLTGPVFNFVQLSPGSDSGMKGDSNTNNKAPTFVGQIGANFLGQASGVIVLAQFNGLHANGVTNLGVGANGRGFVGNYDTYAITDANGNFTITAPAGLPDGLNNIVLVGIGQADQTFLPALSTGTATSVRIDTSLPTMDTSGSHSNGASIPTNSNVNNLNSLTLYIKDPVNPQTLGSPYAVPTLLSVPALDPTTADNINNYALLLADPNGPIPYGNQRYDNESQFINTATFVSTTNRVYTTDPYTGTVTVTFTTGMPSGNYLFVAKQAITDAAGNHLAGTPAAANVVSDFALPFVLQASPAYITDVKAVTVNGSSLVSSNPRAYFELGPGVGQTNSDGTPTPPSAFIINVSNPLPTTDANGKPIDYSKDIWLVASANTQGGTPDGNFGTLGTSDDGTGYSIVQGTTAVVQSYGGATQLGQPGYHEQIVVSLPAGTTLPADYYRLYMPNNVNPTNGTDFRVFDIYGNQLDGEFLGDQTPTGTYEDLLPNGQYRYGLSGDGVPGGSFATAYVVAPHGNVIFADPSYTYNPYNASQYPDGSPSKPYPVLAPEAVPNSINGGNLNSPKNYGPNFNPIYDKSGDGQFEPSALYAAQQLAVNGPVIIVARPGTIFTDPTTGKTTQSTFVLQAPATGNGGVNDGSAAIPAMTTLVFQPGATVKLQNAALLVQNQGSALEILGGTGSGQQVTFTSYANDAVAGDSNHDSSNTAPHPGDWGGIVFRNFDQQNRTSTFPGQMPTTGVASVDNRLKGPGGADAISGADDLMSVVNNAVVSYGGGSVPQGIGTAYSAITMYASRPTVTNSTVSFSGASAASGVGGSYAGVAMDEDSMREDNLARGALVRRVSFISNNLNGILVAAEPNGVIEPTDAMTYPVNPSNIGGAQNYAIANPYPYLFINPMVVGSIFQEETGGQQTSEPDRLYIQPGMLLKLKAGAGIEVQSLGSTGRQPSLNVGVRTYMNEWDNTPTISPVLANGSPNPNFVYNSTDNATVLFTSFFDDKATTNYTNPVTQATTPIVAPLPISTSNPYQPTPGLVPAQARWSGIQIDSPAVAVINNATVQYGGGTVNTPTGTGTRHALELAGAIGFGGGFGGTPSGGGTGAHVMITDNNFQYNLDVPMNITPNGLLAANPDEPLTSGAPFFHNNVMVNNGINGLGVADSFGIRENAVVDVNSVWPGADLTYIVRGTISMGPNVGFIPPADLTGTTPPNERKATLDLTIESTLPGTVLADGSVVPKPGIPAIVKLAGAAPAASTGNTTTPTVGSETNEGAGFVSGMDNGVDPTTDPLVDIGVNSEMRFLGIGANQATGQIRVPVVLTSIHDSSYGTTVRGVTMNVAITGDKAAPAAGDGGNIIFGSHTAAVYNNLDPRQGNLIDNVDAKYMSRIEQIGGGLIQAYDTSGTGTFGGPVLAEMQGQPLTTIDPVTGNPVTTYAVTTNHPNALTVSNSNISDFRDFGFWAHPGFYPITVPLNFNTAIGRALVGFGSEPTMSYLVNDTFSNITDNPAVEIDGGIWSSANVNTTNNAVILNDTFYNNKIGVDLNHPTAPGTSTDVPSSGPGMPGPGAWGTGDPGVTDPAAVALMMNDIFANESVAGIMTTNVVSGSQSQYSLFYQNGVDVQNNGTNWRGNNQAVQGDPSFVNAAGGNFNLGPASKAINASRSELGPTLFGDILFPAANQVLNATGGVLNFLGHTNYTGERQGPTTPLDYVYLPGSILPSFATSWVPVLPTSGSAVAGPSSNAATWDYAPLPILAASSNGTIVVPGNAQNGSGGGVRDQNGVLRNIDANVPITGAGSEPYYDIGAFEYIQYYPPKVTAVTATYLDPTSATGSTTKSIYAVGGIAGTNVAPESLQVTFNHQIDPTTINANTVELEASTDGTFNTNSPTTTFINLAGKLSFNSATDVLTISLGASGLLLNNAEYRLILVGTGSQELRDPQGNPLDGENLDATGQQTALPSGDNIPGGNFQTTFTVDTHAPTLVAGSFTLAASSYSNPDYVGSSITNQAQPTFQGSITDIFPPANPVAGDTVYIDISTAGNGVFNVLNAGVGTTDSSGNFSIKLSTPLPNSAYNVGPDGLFGTSDDSGYSMARVRVVDQSGNVTNTTTGSLQSFIAQGAAYAFAVDTTPPTVDGISPANGAVATPSNGVIPVMVAVNKNIDPKTLTVNSIQVVRTGGSGTFGTNNVTMAIDPTSIKVVPLKTSRLGPEMISFNIIGSANAPLANDIYQVTLKGSGANPILDIAGNPLNGGTDYVSNSYVYSPTLTHLIYVGPASDVTSATAKQGSFANPFPTIAAGINAANVGDTVAVLPGVYTESVTLKSLVSLRSAALTSNDSSLVPGDPLQTIIRAPQSFGPTTTVSGTGLVSAIGGGFSTMLAGFTIASPLTGNAASGPIGTNSIGLNLVNSNIIVANSYFIDSNVGVAVNDSGSNAVLPTFVNDVFAGNVMGVAVLDTATSRLAPLNVYNSDFVYNTMGLAISTTTSAPVLGNVYNSIFWQNRALDGSSGWAVGSSTPNKIALSGDMFADNGPLLSNPSDDTYNVSAGGGFNPAVLTTSAPDPWGNFVGEPNFVAPRDPRPTPGGDGPAVFFLETNFDLAAGSAAIDRSIPAFAPATDMLFRGRVSKGQEWTTSALGQTGPADVGAFEFGGTGGFTSGASSLHVTAATLVSGTVSQATQQTITNFASSGVYAGSSPTALVLKFSSPVNQASVHASDLVISGAGNSGIRATGLTWIDPETVEFMLTGGYQQSGGTVALNLGSGKPLSTTGRAMAGFTDTVTLSQGNPYSPPPVPVPTSPPPSSSGQSPSPTPPPPPPTHSVG